MNDSSTREPPQKKIRSHLPIPSVPPHPWGILPLGNLFFSKTQSDFVDTRIHGLGFFAMWDDAFLLGWIVEYLDAPTLAKMARLSKVWCCFAYYEEIWKGSVLAKWRALPEKSSKQWIQGSWRSTYVALMSKEQSPFSSLHLEIPHFYSDLLYHPHYYSQVPLSYLVDLVRSAHYVTEVPKLSEPSAEHFVQHYETPNLPCILQDAMQKWTFSVPMTWTYLSELLSDVPLHAEAISILFKDFLKYMEHPCTSEEVPVYLFDKNILHSPAFRNRYTLPIYFRSDLFSVLGPKRPDHAWLIVGNEKSGSTHHKDPVL